MSLTTGTFPLDWKTAIIRPLIKEGLIRTNQEKLQTHIKFLFSIQTGEALYVKTTAQTL